MACKPDPISVETRLCETAYIPARVDGQLTNRGETCIAVLNKSSYAVCRVACLEWTEVEEDI